MITTHEPSWVQAVLRRVRQRPGNYLGDERLSSLSNFIEGGLQALEDAQVPTGSSRAFLKAFGDWLGIKAECSNGDAWFNLHVLKKGQETIQDFYDALQDFLCEAGFPHGLDDEQLDISRWPRRADC